MSNSNSVINLGDISKPATVLVEKISDAIGGLCKPWQIKRVASAEAEAEKISAVSQIEITDIQRRAMARFIGEEAIKQANIENVTRKALPEVSESAKPEAIENDWLVNFFDKSRLVSNEEMQNLWAKILAGEANSPGKFSKRTVNFLGSLDKSDAKLFAKLCSFGISLPESTPLIYDPLDSIYVKHGITFAGLSHLDTIGLIQFGSLAGFELQGLSAGGGFIRYFDKGIYIEFPSSDNNSLNIGKVLLTQVGKQLAMICDPQPVEGFAEYVKEKWKTLGYKTEPTLTDPPTTSTPTL